MNRNIELFRIKKCLQEQRKNGERDCRKDILAIKAKVDIQTINELLASEQLFEETKNGEVRITDKKPMKANVEDRERLIRELAYEIKHPPKRIYQPSEAKGRSGGFSR